MKHLFLLSFLALSVNAKAQDLTVKYGAMNKVTWDQGSNVHVYGDANRQLAIYFETVNSKAKRQKAATLNNELQMADAIDWNLPLPNDKMSKTVEMHGIYRQKDHFKVFYKGFYPSDNIAVMYCARMDYSGGFAGAPVALDTIKHKTTMLPGATGVAFTPDSTKFLVYEFLSPATASQLQQVIFKLFDNEVKTVYRTQLELPFQGHKTNVNRLRVDNAGNATFVAAYDAKGKGNERHVFNYDATTKAVKEFPVPKQHDDAVSFSRTDLLYDENHALYFVSRWGKDELYGKGFTVAKVNTTLNKFDYVISKHFEDDLKQYGDMDGKVGENMFIERVYASGSDLVVVMENAYADQQNNAIRSKDVAVMNVKPTGVINYLTTIPKDQLTGNVQDYMYSRYIKTDNFLYVLYNDHEKNIDAMTSKDVGRFMTTMRGGNSVVAAKVNLKDGSFTKSLLTKDRPSEDKYGIFAIDTFTQLDENTYVVKYEVQTQGVFRFAKISVK